MSWLMEIEEEFYCQLVPKERGFSYEERNIYAFYLFYYDYTY
jgi:hypothetical protein